MLETEDKLTEVEPKLEGGDVKELSTKLNWMEDGAEELNTKLEQDVLDGLEPPTVIKELEIHMYTGRQYAWWMQSQVVGGVQGPAPFPFLRVVTLYKFPSLKHLHGLVELPCLELLQLKQMPSLENISGGPFPSLVKLEMSELPCLGEVWIVAERTMPNGEEGGGCCNFTPQLGQVRVGNCLSELKITVCPKLEIKPHIPLSLQHLQLLGSEQLLQPPGQCLWSSSSPNFDQLKKLQLCHVTGLGSGHGWELLQHMTALESLEIINFSGVQTELPESLGELHSLQELTIKSCKSLTNLPQSMGQLTSLQLLSIKMCSVLQQLPDCLGELSSLRRLEMTFLMGLTCLPQSISRLTTSLQELEINACPRIKSLPEGIKGLTALQLLKIHCCPDLERRFKRGNGEDWHLISHIPNLKIMERATYAS